MTKENLSRTMMGGILLYFVGRILSSYVHETTGWVVSVIGILCVLGVVGYKTLHYKEFKKEVWAYLAILVFFVLLALFLYYYNR